jgi:glutamine synthetase
MVGSNMSIAKSNIVINTAVAESLRIFADELEGADDFNSALQALIRKAIKNHKRIIFNGNGYGELWFAEAQSRGLLNLTATPDALPYLLLDKNVALYERHKVFSRTELLSRYDISLENYCKLCNIEAVTMYKLIKKNILYVTSECARELSDAALSKSKFLPEADCSYERDTVMRLSEISAALHKKVSQLYDALGKAEETQDILERAHFFRDIVLAKMSELRELSDELELLVARKHWPFPTYGDLLFSVR